MKKNVSVTDFFTQETRGYTNSLNNYAVSQLQRTGKEIERFGTKKMQGAGVVNPVKSLFKSGKLNQAQFFAATRYQEAVEKANQSNHARVSYDGGIGRSTAPRDCGPRQDQLDSSRDVTLIKEKIGKMYKDITDLRKKRVVKTIRYSLVLEGIIENQMSLNKFEERFGYNRGTISRALIDICDTISDMNCFNRKIDKK